VHPQVLNHSNWTKNEEDMGLELEPKSKKFE
jgi:hypothetical protein